MNTLLIVRRLETAAATPPIKGTRVAVKYGPNEWYIGTVVRSGAKITVAFDDGSTESHPWSALKIKAVEYKRIRKTAITDEQVKVLLGAPAAAAPKAVKTVTPPKVSDIKKPGSATVKKINKATADTWYKERRSQNEWAEWDEFRKDKGWEFYGVFEGATQVSCFGYTLYAARDYIPMLFFPTKREWASILSIFNLPPGTEKSAFELFPSPVGYITGLQTDIGSVGKGYGSMALAFAEGLAKKNKSKLLLLSSKRGSRAYKMYKKAGFIDLCESDLGSGERMMVKACR